jgi:hypothetical protein
VAAGRRAYPRRSPDVSRAAATGAVGVVALVEPPQALEDLGRVEQAVEALGLDAQTLGQRLAPPTDDRLVVRADRRRGSAAIWRARASARSTHVPVGTTSLTRPISSASVAWMTRPVRINSMARR